MSNTETGADMVLNAPIQTIMDLGVLVLDGNDTIADAVERMREKNTRSVLVTHSGEIIGFVSKTDILFKMVAKGRDSSKVRLREIMTSPVLTIHPTATVGEVLAMMDKHAIRQVVIAFRNSIMGLATRERILEEIYRASISTTTLAMSGTPACIINPKAVAVVKEAYASKFPCPYCGSPFDDKDVLSKHIDRIHGGSGSLEGDFRRILD
jgi:CBS domain-containing protein